MVLRDGRWRRGEEGREVQQPRRPRPSHTPTERWTRQRRRGDDGPAAGARCGLPSASAVGRPPCLTEDRPSAPARFERQGLDWSEKIRRGEASRQLAARRLSRVAML